ncbi:hypothetical protein Tsubulata_045248, partial [Turnera subulata]
MSLWGLKDLLSLMLSFNSFNGSLPLQVGQMVALTQLDLSGNQFFGNIPSTLGQLKDLSTLFLWNNGFQGAIPESLGNLKGLEMLDLSSNNLSGNIPKSLEELKSLDYKVYIIKVCFASGGVCEYGLDGVVSMKIDVYSFGIMLMEIFTRRKPTDELFDGGISLTSCVKASLPSSTMNIVDSNMLNGENRNAVNEEKCLVSVMELALQCTHELPEERLNMIDISARLRKIRTLHGYIPPELANLRRMKHLLFSSNNFTDNLITYCVQEDYIIQARTIPYGIFNTSSLVAIGFTYNNIYGILPKNICDILPNLVYLQVSANQLSGKIPSGIWKCRKLQTLSLSFNYFEGPIPEEVGHLPMLWFLFLGANNLTGLYGYEQYLPMLANVPNLQDLFLQYNKLTGNNPASVFNISTLVRISLDGNRHSGFLPKTIGNLRDLQVLYLQKNFLSNDPSNPELDFFTSLANCRALMRLNLEKNLFSGILPQSIGNLTSNLTDLVMGNNMLVGNIPSELGSLSGLIRLSLSGNNLSRPIPATVARMGNLQLMDLSSNKLNGSIPVDICYARSISEENKLSGALPDCIGLLTSLRTLVLDSNSSSSSIPLSLWGLKDLHILSLRFNSISGSFPLQIRQMAALQQLRLYGNCLFGDISSSLGKLQSLHTLDLANNKFQGATPESIGNLRDLRILDLSDNNLSGKIPKSLEELEFLIYLNVSFNKLEGEIPSSGSITNFTGTSYVGNKALYGPPRLQVPLCGSEPHGHSNSTKAILLSISGASGGSFHFS